MTRRRKSHAMRYALTAWAVMIVVALGITVLHVIGWLIITAVISAGTYALGHSQAPARAPGRKLAANAAYGKPGAAQGYTGGSLPRQPVTELDAVSAYPADLTRARRNGWIAPAKSAMLWLSAECAAAECVWCHDARCQHDCPHPSRGPAGDKPPF